MTTRRTGRCVLLALLVAGLPAVGVAREEGAAKAPAAQESPEPSRLRTVDSFGSNPGNLELLTYVPAELSEGAPLVVVAHGCFQTALVLAQSSGWVEMAERYRFALLFPQTSKDNEPFGGCFRTWVPEHQRRDAGEPLSIRQMIAWMLATHRLDPRRVFMVGMSSGGLLTEVLLATYPELFAAGAVQSAYPYNCASQFEDLKTCSAGQRELAGDAWAQLVLDAYPGYSGPRPRVSLWHGEADPLLLPVNLELETEQWTRVLGVDREPDEIEEIAGHRRERFSDAAGNARVETYLVRGMEHAIAIDPDGTPQCGSTAPFITDADICSALWVARWFGIAR